MCSLQVGLGQVLELVGELLQYLQTFMVNVVYRLENVRELTLNRIQTQAAMLFELRPVRQIRELPPQIQQLLRDLQELSKILLQLVINTTPLYNMVGNQQELSEHTRNTSNTQRSSQMFFWVIYR